MIYNLKILPLAKNDLIEIVDWYQNIQKGLEKQFLNSIREEVKIIRYNPKIYQIRYDSTRVALIKTFPYLIHFEINKKEIIIKAIIHSSRDSKTWKNLKNH
ncbi:type II toxin-antitoxin system RelE/ParE family toxin [Flavobacterium sp. GP15]|uniref:type II toxin-antitoxin system RelE/ParE family toxin n=1 Tax=Flavobacterium sp. GP15 TaxID=2758567 RepID=UPI00165E6352|nr:type II toxin-antitoxin system RelE/ParE family toxin [Flavobacterium sp. GP15]